MIQIIKLPDYFAEKGYQCPSDAFDGPFQYSMGTKLHAFDWIEANPKHQHAFNVTMTMRMQRSGGTKWFETFPVERVLEQIVPSDTFMVDIGGGWGQNSIDLKEKHSTIPGKFIVQDIPAVVDSVKGLPSGVEAMAHDFFKPQPVRHAKIYFFANILHDWPDKQAKIILDHTREAMGPDSVLLLSETVMPDRNVSFVPAVMDLTMMAAFSSLERTETQFRDLLSAAGLELVQIWGAKQTASQNISRGHTILEARLKK